MGDSSIAMVHRRRQAEWKSRALHWARTALTIALLTAGVYLAVCLVLGIALAESTLHMHPREIVSTVAFRTRMQKQFHARVENSSVNAADGAVLRAWYVEPAIPNGRSVMLLHGIAGNRVDVSGFADIFVRRGYSVLLPDSREHGESGGRIATFGLLEREDIRRWTEWVRQRAPGCTYLVGESMGAAIGVEATAVTPQLCAVAAEDSFATFREVVFERLGHDTGLGTRFWLTAGLPVVRSAIGWAHLRYRVWLPDAAPVVAITQSQIPVLLMTGTADSNVPMHHAVELERRCGSRCTLWVVPGADHGGISSVTGAEFGRRMLAWFAEHDRETAVPGKHDSGGVGHVESTIATFAPAASLR